jgi:hypothetical protein
VIRADAQGVIRGIPERRRALRPLETDAHAVELPRWGRRVAFQRWSVRCFARKGWSLRLPLRQTIGSHASFGLGSICPPLIPAIRTFFPHPNEQ